MKNTGGLYMATGPSTVESNYLYVLPDGFVKTVEDMVS